MNLSRSPYIIEISETGQEGSKLELFLWNTGSQPTDPQYTLDKLIPASNNIKTYYNISPYVREYYNFTTWQNIYNTYDVDTSTDFIVQYAAKRYKLVSGVYTLVSTETGEFMDGYNYYMDGQAAADDVHLSEGTYFYNYDANVASALPQNMAGSFDIELDLASTIKYTNLVTGATNIVTPTVAGMKTFARVYEPYLADGNRVDKIIGGVPRWTAYFKPQCEPKYYPVTIDFINRFGSWARIFFQKAKKRSISVKTNEYKFNPATLPNVPSSTGNGQIKEFNTNGKETIKLNTGWVNDLYAEYIQELMLSERVLLLDYETDTNYTPVKIKTKSLEKQVGLNNGMINYELEFEFAYDMINTAI